MTRIRTFLMIAFLVFLITPTVIAQEPVYPTPQPITADLLTRRPTTEPQRVATVAATVVATSAVTVEPTETAVHTSTPDATSQPEQISDSDELTAIAVIRAVCLSVLFLFVLLGTVIYLWRRNR